MIDLHSHILPGVDDGANSFEESFQLAELYEQLGYKKVVATPHARAGDLCLKQAWDVLSGVVRLNRKLHEHGINLLVLPGMEMAFDACLSEKIKNKTAVTLAQGNYLLIETPFTRLPQEWQQVMFELAILGIKVMFAHPERCAQLAHEPSIIEKMVAVGVYFQVNWDSFLGKNGHAANRVACYMARRGLIHCLATDSHRPGLRDPGIITLAIEVVDRLIGPQNLELVSKSNPARVLEGQVLEKIDLNTVPYRSRFRQLIPNSFNPL